MGLMLKKPEGVAGSTAPAILVGLFVAFGGVLYGYDTGTIGGILGMKHWRDLFSTGFINKKDGEPDVTAEQTSLIVSILSAGTFFGALTAAPTADLLGRRLGLVISTVVFCVGVVLQTIATAIPMFVAGRFFAGYGVGMISAIIPLYQSETAPKWIRGAIVGCYQFAITIGLLLAAIVDNATKDRPDTGSYRIPIAVQFAWAIVIFVGCIWLPETPRWFIKKGRPEQAAKSLSTLRRLDVDDPSLVEELAEITANHEYEMSLGKASYFDCFRGNLGKRLATGCLLQSLQQLTGVNFIFYYGTSFFQNSGIKNAFVVTMITSCVNVASTVPGLYLVEKWGRRNLLLFGAVGMAVCQFIVAITVAWVVTGEIFPLKVRAKSLSMTTASNWLLNFAIGYATPYMVNSGPGNANMGAKVFFVWGGCCFVCIFFVYGLIYETKGLSLEQVDELYGKCAHAWKSPGFVPSVSFQDVQDIGANNRSASLTDIEADAQRKRSATYNEKLAV
ncbi:ProP Permease of the major facilitator superfamily [Pyrenophora tritici-repentis]|uniref:ProP, Permease major facilitator superfamily n=1 Tax=Pyrenophora tritici-repentis TaxID=45151 RepID=A0A2W1FRV8_9PLEO|nr:High affinity glucose transporter RGT2 [Pyrenophora tritici-repentis]KAF7445843.1 High affinity glucose transporter RGT2 [Pyrenophora tritici-repentis]KAF7566971.1 ProP, Permease major facilitator superfamily [Pyrenophora tritici-repentis]KAG9381557.1 High affinity glucose transporter RGT2 [Pyrenophora tritici-repentis]KAI0573412.1 High affinity glucose transporter RGT2 [Pyrenophora tritici-repentis]